MSAIQSIYRYLFARRRFYKFNRLLYRCSLRGMGILNFESAALSGERCFLAGYLKGLPRGACVIDVGANIGDYSKLVLELHPAVTLYAFEPHPKTFTRLVSNIPANEARHLINAAVGSKDGELVLYDYKSNDGSAHASVYKEVIEDIHHGQAIAHRVPMVRLDDFLKERGVEKIDLLKIDTEGNELEVLLGSNDYINSGKVAAIHFEFNEMNVVSRTYFRDFWSLLRNYDIYRLLPNGSVRIDEYSAVHCEIFAYQNIVAIEKKNSPAPCDRD